MDSRPDSLEEIIKNKKGFWEDLNACLQALKNPRHREVFILRDVEKLSEKDTGAALGVPEGSVKGWLRRARLELRDCLRAKGWGSHESA